MANQVLVISPPVDPEAEQRLLQKEAFLGKMRTRFRLVAAAESQLRTDMLEDLKFCSGEHWPYELLTGRLQEGRPAITINRIPQFIRQVTNQQRASRPAIKVNPKDGKSKIDTAEVYQGLVRDIEVQSDADVAYSTAGDAQARIGRGYVRILTQFAEDDAPTFQQEIRIKRVRNPFTIYMDAQCQQPDYSDANYGFVVEDLLPDEFRERFPDAESASLEAFTTIGDDKLEWLPGGTVRIVEYWYVELVRDTLYHLRWPADPNDPPDLPPRDTETLASSIDLESLPPEMRPKIVKQREVKRRQVMVALCNAAEVLDGDEDGTAGKRWPGKWIPIVPVLGEEYDIEGRVDLRGMTRDGKDPARTYDYWITAATEAVALAPKAPWVMAEGQDEGYEAEWDQANIKNYAKLRYKPKSIDGNLIPPPQRNAVEPPIQAMVQLVRQADNDQKATMGFFDASLGEQGPESSGKAILARQKQGEIGSSNYLDNLARCIRQVGRVVVDLIPHIYDTARVIRVLGPDGSAKLLYHHPGPVPDGTKPPEGTEGIVDLTKGAYDVTITVGPSFQSLRQEANAQLGQLLQGDAKLFPLLGDLYLGSLDAPWAKIAAARIKKTMPPGLADDEDQDTEISPQVQAQMTQMAHMVQDLSQRLVAANQKLEGKDLEAQKKAEVDFAKMASQERIAAGHDQADILMAALRAKLASAQSLMESELAKFQQIRDQAHEAGMALMNAALTTTPPPPPPAGPQGPQGPGGTPPPGAPPPPPGGPAGPAPDAQPTGVPDANAAPPPLGGGPAS